MSFQHPQHTTFALRFLPQFVTVLGEQIPDRVGRLEFERQHAFGRENPQQHLHAVLQLFCP